MRDQKSGIKMGSAVLKGIILRLPHHSLVDNKLLRKQLIFQITPLQVSYFYIPSKSDNRRKRVHPSLYSNCHHEIIVKFKLQIFDPPSFLLKVRHYRDVKTKLIEPSVAIFDWEKA